MIRILFVVLFVSKFANAEEIVRRQLIEIEGIQFELRVTDEEYRKMPMWQIADKTDPPVEIREAYSLAKTWIDDSTFEGDEYVFSGAILEPVTIFDIRKEGGGKWMWKITFSNFRFNGFKKSGGSFSVWVGMNGHVITPKKVKTEKVTGSVRGKAKGSVREK